MSNSSDEGGSPRAAVGWFRSHPRSDLTLGERDLEIANTLFQQPWQVTVVLRPGNSTMTRGRIFFRESAGPLAANASFHEFTLNPSVFDAPLETAAATTELAPMPGCAMEDLPPETDAHYASTAEAGARELAPVPDPTVEDPPPQTDARHASTARRWKATLWPAALIALAGLVSATYWFGRPQGLTLRLMDAEGQLRISWDRNAKAVNQGRNAHLEINDGGAKAWVELDGEQLRDGNVTYLRYSSNVTVRLVVPRAGVAPIEEVARFLGPLEQPAAVERVQNSPVGSASRAQSGDVGIVPRGTAELVVAVPVEPAPAAVAPPKFTPPRAMPEASAAGKSSVPDLSLPPVVAHDGASYAVPPTPHAQLAVEKLTALPPPTAGPPAPAASTLASSRPVSTPASAIQNPMRPASATHLSAQPVSGRLIWIGRLQKNQTLTIKGKNCSTGTLIGELPNHPIKFSLSPGDLSTDGIVLYTANSQYANNVVEPPGAENGWNKTVYTWNRKFANDVTVQEASSAHNGWSIVLRGRNPKISVIVIDWALVK